MLRSYHNGLSNECLNRQTTISDHYTVLTAMSGVVVKAYKSSETTQSHRESCKTNSESALNFLFLLDKTLKNSKTLETI